MASQIDNRLSGDRLERNERALGVREQNTNAVKAVADMIRTSLGPLGMDKLINTSKGEVIITNDGATILREMRAAHPAAKILAELSEAQDVEAGDGTTSVVVITGSLISEAASLMEKGLHPQSIVDGFLKANEMSQQILDDMAVPVDIHNREEVLKAVATSLQSKVVGSLASSLAPIAVDSVMRCRIEGCNEIDLRDVRVVKQIGGTVDDSELVNGLVLANQQISKIGGGPIYMKDAKIGVIQFCISLPKANMDQQICIKDYTSMDRLLQQEKLQIAKMVRKIKDTGCNVLLIQKSIVREAVSELALDFLSKFKILVIRDIAREEIEFISKTLGCEPVASLDHFTADRLGRAGTVEEVSEGGTVLVKFIDTPACRTSSVILRASNQLTLDEADRSFRDAICIVRSLIRHQMLLPGGGAAEMEVATKLAKASLDMPGTLGDIVKAYGRALEVIPYTLAENAGLKPVDVLTALRSKHMKGFKFSGVNVKTGTASDDMIKELSIIQPAIVTKSILNLSTETAQMILRIDDIVLCR